MCSRPLAWPLRAVGRPACHSASQCRGGGGRASGGRGGAGHHIRVCRDMIAAVPLRTESQPKCLYAFFGIINIIIHQWNNAPNDRCGVRPVTGTAHAQRNSMPLYRAGGRHLRPALPASGGVYSACTDHCIGLGIFGESDLCAEDTTRWWDAGLDHTSATDMFHKARRRMCEGAPARAAWDPGIRGERATRRLRRTSRIYDETMKPQR